MKPLKRYLAGEAKNFRELELLIAALEYIELASESIAAMEKYVSGLRGYLNSRLLISQYKRQGQKREPHQPPQSVTAN